MDRESNCLMIDGRKFDDIRDFDVLQKQSIRNPSCPWIVPYSEDAMQDILSLNDIPQLIPESKKITSESTFENYSI